MIIKRNMAIDSLTRVCEESLALIKQLIDADNETYGQGYEDGMAAQAKVQQTLRPWVDLTDEDKESFWTADQMTQEEWDELFNAIEAKLKEKNT
jgi:hypothetical protein